LLRKSHRRNSKS